MTKTGRTLSEYLRMGADGKVALISFINYLPMDSALFKAMNPEDEFGEWTTTVKTNAILADFFDAYVAANTRKGRKPLTYPRPRAKKKVGRGAISISEFWDWWNRGD